MVDGQVLRHPVAAKVGEVAVATADRLLREAGTVPPPTVHMFMDDLDQPYVGYISTRPFYQGADAARAIARLGELPAAMYANRLLLVWENADLRTALRAVGEAFDPALVTVEATFTSHTLTWHPYTIKVGRKGIFGFATVKPTWGRPVTHQDCALPAPIRDVLTRWRALGGDEIETTITALAKEGFNVRLVSRET